MRASTGRLKATRRHQAHVSDPARSSASTHMAVAGLHSDRLVRLRAGCIRWQRGTASPVAATTHTVTSAIARLDSHPSGRRLDADISHLRGAPMRPANASVLEAIGNTPVVRLRQLTGQNSADVYVKLEGANPTGSYKDRMALAMIE